MRVSVFGGRLVVNVVTVVVAVIINDDDDDDDDMLPSAVRFGLRMRMEARTRTKG